MNGIPGLCHNTQHRRFTLLGHRGLTTGDPKGSGLVLGQDLSFKYGQESLIFLNLDEKFRPFHTGVYKCGAHFDAFRSPAEEMRSAL